MSVQGYCEYDCYWSEKKRDVVSADFVCPVVNARDCQKTDDENGRDENRVQERVPPFVADEHSDFKSDKRKNYSEHRALFVFRFFA